MNRASMVLAAVAALTSVFWLSIVNSADAVRASTMSSVRSISSPGTFGPGGAGSISGGVMQEGDIQYFFVEKNGKALPVGAPAIEFSATGDTDYPFGLSHEGVSYLLPLKQSWACPVARFVQSGSPILFTIPPSEVSDEQQEMYLLEEIDGVFVHRAFTDASGEMAAFLEELDLMSDTDDSLTKDDETLLKNLTRSPNTEQLLKAQAEVTRKSLEAERVRRAEMYARYEAELTAELSTAKTSDEKAEIQDELAYVEELRAAAVERIDEMLALHTSGELDRFDFEEGSYLNNDLNTVYEAYLTAKNEVVDRPVVDMAGLPFRYNYGILEDRSLYVETVERFAFPEPGSAQHDYVIFYQNVAALRTMHRVNKAQFDSIVRKTCPQ